jgi:hypothetical protein
MFDANGKRIRRPRSRPIMSSRAFQNPQPKVQIRNRFKPKPRVVVHHDGRPVPKEDVSTKAMKSDLYL